MDTVLDLALGPLFRTALLLCVLGLLWAGACRSYRGVRAGGDMLWWSVAAVLLLGATFLADHLLLLDVDLPGVGQDAGAAAAFLLLPVVLIAGYRLLRRKAGRGRLVAAGAAFCCLVCGLCCHYEQLSPVSYEATLLLHALCAEVFLVALVVPLLRTRAVAP